MSKEKKENKEVAGDYKINSKEEKNKVVTLEIEWPFEKLESKREAAEQD